MAPAAPGVSPPPGGPSLLRREEMHGTDGASLITRPHALNHFIDMHAAAAASAGSNAGTVPAPAPPPPPPEPASAPGCLCFRSSSPPPQPHRGNLGGVGEARRAAAARAPRAYFPDNLSAQPEPHPWEPRMEWVIIGCVDFLENHGLDEPNLFAVSAVEDLVRALTLPQGKSLPPTTDPHVAAGAIKAKVRHAKEPLVPKSCLRRYIEETKVTSDKPKTGPAAEYPDTHLAATITEIRKEVSARRSYIFARFLRLLGRVSANEASSRMNAHCLAKCVAPSMLHWDPNSTYALLMLGKITGYVMAMIDEARVHDQALCDVIADLEAEGPDTGAEATRASMKSAASPNTNPAQSPPHGSVRASKRVV